MLQYGGVSAVVRATPMTLLAVQVGLSVLSDYTLQIKYSLRYLCQAMSYIHFTLASYSLHAHTSIMMGSASPCDRGRSPDPR